MKVFENMLAGEPPNFDNLANEIKFANLQRFSKTLWDTVPQTEPVTGFALRIADLFDQSPTPALYHLILSPV